MPYGAIITFFSIKGLKNGEKTPSARPKIAGTPFQIYLHGLKNYCQKTPKTLGCDQQTYDNLNILIRALADNKANNRV